MPGHVQALIGSYKTSIPVASLSGAWSGISLVYPTSNGTNETRTVTWAGGGSRDFSASFSLTGTLSYSKNSGAYTDYSAPISLTSGDTLSWRFVSGGADESAIVTVTDDAAGATLDAFAVGITGSP